MDAEDSKRVLASVSERPNGGWVTVFIPQTVVPVDSTGSVLSTSAPTEAAQEAYYASYDQVSFGESRRGPVSVNIPDEYAGSFAGSSDEEIVPGIGAALIAMGVNQSEIPAGTVITVTFTDGSTAQYVKAYYASTILQWAWNGVAHNKKGQRIDRNGNVIANTNTSGSGSGHVSVSAPGPNSTTYQWNVTGEGLCTFVDDVTIFDIGTGNPISSSVGTYVQPC